MHTVTRHELSVQQGERSLVAFQVVRTSAGCRSAGGIQRRGQQPDVNRVWGCFSEILEAVYVCQVVVGLSAQDAGCACKLSKQSGLVLSRMIGPLPAKVKVNTNNLCLWADVRHGCWTPGAAAAELLWTGHPKLSLLIRQTCLGARAVGRK
jgi:hypothetical protein